MDGSESTGQRVKYAKSSTQPFASHLTIIRASQAKRPRSKEAAKLGAADDSY